MRFISCLDQHPEIRRKRFPEPLWPNGSNEKEIEEGWTFLEFAAAAGCTLSSAPTKRQPPFPDLECELDGKPVLFELGEILEIGLAAGIAHSGKQAQEKADAIVRGDAVAADSIETWGLRTFAGNASLERMLRQKLGKRYETAGLETNLLLYYDQQTPRGPFDHLLQWQNVVERLT